MLISTNCRKFLIYIIHLLYTCIISIMAIDHMKILCFFLQIKDNLLAKPDARPEEGGEEVGGGATVATSEPCNIQAMDELKRAFELVEASNPGLSALLLQKVISHLQRRYIT